MNQPPSQIPDALRARFPALRPVRKAPPLTTLNGIGLTLYGKRDVDAETGTYVKTHVFCVLFVPVFSIGAYRVADAERGWYFLGKEPLSPFAKNCNWGVLGLALLLAAILTERAYKSSPEFIARQEIKRADQALASGNELEAAKIYDAVVNGDADVDSARARLAEALQRCLTNPSPETVQGGFRLLAARKARGSGESIPKGYEKGVAAIERFRTTPEPALDILAEVKRLGPATNPALEQVQIELLRAAIAAQPDRTNRVEELALLHESRGDLPAAVSVLEPYGQKLGASEGARILGKHLLDQGKYDAAYGLLFPYVQARLMRLHTIEKNYTNAMAAAYSRAIEHLQEGKADRSFYIDYERAPKPQQERMVDEFVQKWMRQDPGLLRAVEELRAANKIVTVTLDLGIVQLNRAQALSEPVARRAELEAAEKTFLAIRALAGDTDEYRMFLGQVYYWLGRSQEGHALFEELLQANNRAFGILLALGRTLREVGDADQARAMIEEAYNKATDPQDKHVAASMRARIQKDVDDQITWLEKADANDPAIQAALDDARGDKAAQMGDRTGAVKHMRSAIAAYEKLPVTAATLNNCGLVWLGLFHVTGDLQDCTRGLNLVEQALALSPGDSLLLVNATHLFLNRACINVVGDSIGYQLLQQSPDVGMLMHLYNDDAGRSRVFQRLREDAYMKKALLCLDKALLLAPKNYQLYRLELYLQGCFRDLAELTRLEQRLQVAAPDCTTAKQESLEAYQGAKERESLDRLQREIQRYQKLVDSATVQAHPATHHFARIELVELKLAAAQMGEATEIEALAKESGELHAARPSSASLGLLINVEFQRAHLDLKRREPAYARHAAQTRRSLTPQQLIALLLERDAALAKSIRQSPSVLRAIELMKQQRLLFPSTPDCQYWALLRAFDPQDAARTLKVWTDDKPGRVRDRLQRALHPLASTCVLEEYWEKEMAADSTAAFAIYDEARKQGVPLPVF